jgi:hypothetical protein
MWAVSSTARFVPAASCLTQAIAAQDRIVIGGASSAELYTPIAAFEGF